MSNTQKTERINLVLSPSELTRLDAWARMRKVSRAEAVRTLLAFGIAATENAQELLDRCAKAYNDGATFGKIIADILEGHQLVESVTIQDGTLSALLKPDESGLVFELAYNKEMDFWGLAPLLDSPDEGALAALPSEDRSIRDEPIDLEAFVPKSRNQTKNAG